MTPEQLAVRIRSWAAPVPAPAVVAFDGPSGSGKTTLARAVLARLPDAAALHLDDLYPGWDGLDDVVPLLAGVLAQLAGPGLIVVPAWDWARDAPGTPRPRPDLGPPRPAIVLVDGIGSGARACAGGVAALIWVDAAEPVRKQRALARDGETYAPHWDRWARQERVYVARERTPERADLVLDTSSDAENPMVLRDGGSVASPR